MISITRRPLPPFVLPKHLKRDAVDEPGRHDIFAYVADLKHTRSGTSPRAELDREPDRLCTTG